MKIANALNNITETLKSIGFESEGTAFDKYGKKYNVWSKDGIKYHCGGVDLQTNEISLKDISNIKLK